MADIQRRTLGRTGITVPALCMGCGSLATGHDPQQVEEMLEAGWSEGLRYFDTAPLYRGSEERLGAFLAGRPRAEYALATKVGRYPAPAGMRRLSLKYDDVAQSVDDSLRKMGTDRLDVLSIHDFSPQMFGEDFESAQRDLLDGSLKLLMDLRDQGVVGALGMGTYDCVTALSLLKQAPFDLVMVVGAHTLLSREADEELLPYCETKQIGVLAASPFHTGLLITGAVSGARFNFQPASAQQLEHVAAIETICRRHEVPLAAAALRYGLRHPAIAGIVAGHATAQEVLDNVRFLTLAIPEALWQDLAAAGLIPPERP